MTVDEADISPLAPVRDRYLIDGVVCGGRLSAGVVGELGELGEHSVYDHVQDAVLAGGRPGS